jgi:hypothetical protein
MSLYFWRFLENTANYPGWNLAASAGGTKCLLDALERLSISETEGLNLTCAAPDRQVLKVPNNADSPVVAAIRVQLVRADDTDAGQLVEERGEVTLRLTLKQVAQVQRALRDPPAAFDTAIIEDPDVWYWGVV